MKKLLIGLIALTITLGVACKKDEISDPKASVSNDMKSSIKFNGEKKMNGEDDGEIYVSSDIVGKNPFGLDGNYTADYGNAHPWSVAYPDGWPTIHGPHGPCLGTVINTLPSGIRHSFC